MLKKKKKSEDLYVNPEDLIVNIINTRTKLQNTQNDKSHRLSLSAFVLMEPKKAATWINRERKKEEEEKKKGEEEEKNWGFEVSYSNLLNWGLNSQR